MTTKDTQGPGGMSHGEHSELWAELNKLRQKQSDADVATARMDERLAGKLDRIADRQASMAEQCERVEASTMQIERHLRDQNGRIGKSEQAIAALQAGAAIASRGHVRADDHAPRKGLGAYSKKQQTGVLAGGVLIVLGAFDLLKEIGAIAMALMKRGATP